METLERHAPSAAIPAGGPGGAPEGGSQLGTYHEEMERFHHASEEAIDRALSQDSVEFMYAVRQEHGE